VPASANLIPVYRQENPSENAMGQADESEPPTKRVKSSNAPKFKPASKPAKKRATDPAIDQAPVRKNKDDKWLVSLEKLKAYKQQSGDCIVPRGYAQDPQLASWVAEQR
jgi:hypothetical protein